MRSLARVACAAAMLGIAAPASGGVFDFTGYFAFGDSLTQDGKGGPLAPPSLNGRYTNGLTYADRIAQDFAAASLPTGNFALGGATAGPVNTTPYPDPAAAAPFATFPAQVASFASRMPSAFAGDNPLFSVLFGPNDIFQNLFTPDIGAVAADFVEAGIRSIAALDADFDSFVVMTLPDLSATPRFLGTPLEGLALATTNAFNARLAANVGDLRASGLDIIGFDLFALQNDLLANAGALGITNTTEGCSASLLAFDPTSCALTGGFPPVDLALADAFFYVDGLHPNRIVHREAAAGFRAAVAAAVVPLPAGLPLLLAGLGAMGALRLRRGRAGHAGH